MTEERRRKLAALSPEAKALQLRKLNKRPDRSNAKVKADRQRPDQTLTTEDLEEREMLKRTLEDDDEMLSGE